MDARQCMIVDLEKRGDWRMFVTEQISSICENTNGQWAVRFAPNGKVFNYNKSRLLYLTRPDMIDLDEKGLYINNRHITDVAELLRFSDGRHTFYRVTHANGYYECIDASNVYITRTPINKNGGSTWEYLIKLATETGLTIDGDDGEKVNILLKQYGLVDTKRDNVPLAQFLGDKTKLASYRLANQVYYPFGCNASQKAAVEAALTNQVSIIQGPPGTGKTQTILNIIANLLLKNKTVLVVSNNNSAIENIADKLNKEGLGFIVAKLGSRENKESFIANQQPYPDMSEWIIDSTYATEKIASEALHVASQGFDGQLRQSRLRAEYDALLKETKYNEMLDVSIVDLHGLNEKSSAKLLTLLNLYQHLTERGKRPGMWFRLHWCLKLGIGMFSFLNQEATDIIHSLESAFYKSRINEIESELQTIEERLGSIDIKQCVKDLRQSSLQILKHKIAQVFKGQRHLFNINDIPHKSEYFLKEYPIVLSTTYSAKSCISKNMVFDYVIMDEASQVDIKTGALALSCAINAVIVGDDKQLPNVVSRDEALALNAIQTAYNVDDRYNAVTHSFLQSCNEIFKDVPTTLLREHYRCHPKIIEFCNQRFYNGELLAMTTDNNETNVLQLIRTAKGNHARGHFNQREIDTITQEVMPDYTCNDNVGIITPYRLQAEEINKALGQDIASTVHKYQGRECDTIIMSMVDNEPTEFSDDTNLLNVAISRAKTHLCVVISGNVIPANSNLGQLIAYMQYNNFEIKASKLHSVFDLLYKQYTEERLKYEATHPTVSEYLTENLIYNLLTKSISQLGLTNIGILCHYPISRLIGDWSLLNNEEKSFAENALSHVDFLIYNTLTKQPLRTIEVDGWHFHKDNYNEVQRHRDAIKDRLLAKFGITLHRISTTDMVTEESIKSLLDDLYGTL